MIKIADIKTIEFVLEEPIYICECGKKVKFTTLHDACPVCHKSISEIGEPNQQKR